MNRLGDEAGNRTRTAGIIGAVAVIVIIVAGFLVSVPVTKATAFPVVVASTSTVTYYTDSLQVTTQPVFVIGNNVTGSNNVTWLYNAAVGQNYTYASALLPRDSEVSETISSDRNWVDVFVFDAVQFAAYQQNGTRYPSFVSSTGQSGPTLNWEVLLTDTYYLVLQTRSNPPTSFNFASGTLTHWGSQYVTYTTTSQTLVSNTVTSTTTKTCSFPFWNWVAGSKSCP